MYSSRVHWLLFTRRYHLTTPANFGRPLRLYTFADDPVFAHLLRVLWSSPRDLLYFVSPRPDLRSIVEDPSRCSRFSNLRLPLRPCSISQQACKEVRRTQERFSLVPRGDRFSLSELNRMGLAFSLHFWDRGCGILFLQCLSYSM